MTSKVKQILAAILAISFLFPLAYLFVLSLASQWQFPEILPRHLSFANWLGMFSTQKELLRSFILSLTVAVTVAFSVTALGFVTCRFIAYHRHRRYLLLLAYFPFILSPVIYAAFIYFYFVKFGLTGNLGGVILGQLIVAYPFSVILFGGYWNERLKALEDLVATLGGNARQTFLRVLVPISKGMLLVCFFQTFLISWFEYGLTSLIGVGKIQTLTIKVYQYLSEANIYYAALSSCFLMLPPALLLWVNKKFVFTKLP
jgi:putative spermidine/putrescine transport system permease protein